MGLWETLFGSRGPKLVRVAVARHMPESELMLSLLRDAEIPAMARRTAGFDVPDMLAAGPRDIVVPEHFEADAREVLQTLGEAPGSDDT